MLPFLTMRYFHSQSWKYSIKSMQRGCLGTCRSPDTWCPLAVNSPVNFLFLFSHWPKSAQLDTRRQQVNCLMSTVLDVWTSFRGVGGRAASLGLQCMCENRLSKSMASALLSYAPPPQKHQHFPLWAKTAAGNWVWRVSPNKADYTFYSGKKGEKTWEIIYCTTNLIHCKKVYRNLYYSPPPPHTKKIHCVKCK